MHSCYYPGTNVGRELSRYLARLLVLIPEQLTLFRIIIIMRQELTNANLVTSARISRTVSNQILERNFIRKEYCCHCEDDDICLPK
jgi:hypothetical protein